MIPIGVHYSGSQSVADEYGGVSAFDPNAAGPGGSDRIVGDIENQGGGIDCSPTAQLNITRGYGSLSRYGTAGVLIQYIPDNRLDIRGVADIADNELQLFCILLYVKVQPLADRQPLYSSELTLELTVGQEREGVSRLGSVVVDELDFQGSADGERTGHVQLVVLGSGGQASDLYMEDGAPFYESAGFNLTVQEGIVTNDVELSRRIARTAEPADQDIPENRTGSGETLYGQTVRQHQG